MENYACPDCGNIIKESVRALHEGRCTQQNNRPQHQNPWSQNSDYNQMRESPFKRLSGGTNHPSHAHGSQKSAFENYQSSQNKYSQGSHNKNAHSNRQAIFGNGSRNNNPFEDHSDDENSLDENSQVSNQIQNYSATRNNYPQFSQDHARTRLTTSSSQRHQERRESIAQAHQSQEDTFICYKCTGLFNLRDFATHEVNCEYTSCQFCHEFFPNFIMEDHLDVCEKNTQASQSHSDSHMEEEENSHYTDYSEYDDEEDENMDRHSFFQAERARGSNQHPGNAFVSNSQEARARGNNQSQQGNVPGPRQQQNPFSGIGNPMFMPPGGTIRTRVIVNGRVVEDSNVNNNQPAGLNDVFGFFSLFGASPFDPLQSSRQSLSRQRIEATPVRRPVDPMEEMISAFVNTVRMNRSRRSEHHFISALMEILRANGGQVSRGVDPDSMNRIQTKQFQKNPNVRQGEEELCPVCQCEFEDEQTVKVLPCNHIYHPECIDPWLANNTKCPSCRQDVEEGLAANRR